MTKTAEDPASPPWPAGFSAVCHRAWQRLEDRLDQAGPPLSTRLRPWQQSLAADDARPIAYFHHPLAYPTLSLPWFVEEHLCGRADPALQADLVLSSLCGYYHVRLVDDVMDEGAQEPRRLLPALHVYRLGFEAPYRTRFPGDHPFWADFERISLVAARATLADALASELDLETFERVAARKTAAIGIPIRAVLHARSGLEAAETWDPFIHRFGCWHQMLNDLLDWQRDLARGACTWLTSEARRQGGSDSAAAAWILGEGFPQAQELLAGWWRELEGLARPLRSPGLHRYLRWRERDLEHRMNRIRATVDRLAGALGPGALGLLRGSSG